jgi:hypothetical protein
MLAYSLVNLLWAALVAMIHRGVGVAKLGTRELSSATGNVVLHRSETKECQDMAPSQMRCNGTAQVVDCKRLTRARSLAVCS